MEESSGSKNSLYNAHETRSDILCRVLCSLGLRHTGTLWHHNIARDSKLFYIFAEICRKKSYYPNYKAGSVAQTHPFPYKAMRNARPVKDA